MNYKNMAKQFGRLLGLTDVDSKKWERKAGIHIMDGRFGIHLKQPVPDHLQTQHGFLDEADKMLSQISSEQKYQESQEPPDPKDTSQAADGNIDGTADVPLTITTPRPTRSLDKQCVYNMGYVDSETGTITISDRVRGQKKSLSKLTIKSEKSLNRDPDSHKQKAIKADLDQYVEYQRSVDKIVLENLDNTDTDSEQGRTKIVFFDEAKSPSMENQKGSAQAVQTDVNEVLQDSMQSDRWASKVLHEDVKETNREEAGMPDKGEKDELKLTKEDLVYGKAALKHYNFYVQIEQREERVDLEIEMIDRMEEYDWKVKALQEMDIIARGYFLRRRKKKDTRWGDLKRHVKQSSSHQIGRTEVRFKLGDLPEYLPFFTYFIMFVQLVSFIVIWGLKGFTFVGVEPKLSIESSIPTFFGVETVHKWTQPNIWIGPSDQDLISVGAVFAPCMRTDIQLQIENSHLNYSTDLSLGCCEVASRNVAGTTTQDECAFLTEGVGQWRADVPCSSRPGDQSSVKHALRPCCVGIKGQCQLLSHKHCLFLGGIYQQFGPEHCSQVNCLENICKSSSTESSRSQPWLLESPAQWWRVLVSVFYHHGIIELVIVLVSQVILYRQIEIMAGWLRMLIIHLLAGYFSLLTSALFSPYESHVGAVGSVCGMLGVLLVELTQFWSLVNKPWKELLKILAAIVVLLFCGTFPYLDFFGIISGLISGALIGIIVLPYVTFGRWHFWGRLILILVASGLLVFLCSLLIHTFVSVQSVESCTGCKYINCLPFSENICASEIEHS